MDVLHNLQAYDSELTIEWSPTLAAGDWHAATFNPAADVPHNDGTLTRRWLLPDDAPQLFYRLRAKLRTPP